MIIRKTPQHADTSFIAEAARMVSLYREKARKRARLKKETKKEEEAVMVAGEKKQT